MTTALQHSLASLAIADAISLHWFGLRELVVLDFIRRQSFGAGRCEAYIPSLRYFAAATRIKEDNLKKVLRNLAAQRVIEERPQSYYGFVLPWENWKAEPRAEQAEVIRQLSLLDEPAHLREAMRQTFVERCAVAGGAANLPGLAPGSAGARETPAGGHPAEPAPAAVVPESGTRPVPAACRTQIGYGSFEPINTGFSAPVPELGTTGTMKHCKNEGTKHCFNVSLNTTEAGAVGDRPPPRPARERGVRFSAEQQELFDECGRVGAFNARDEAGRPIRNGSRGCWWDMVSRRPAVVRWLLSEYRNARVARVISNPGGFMMETWKSAGRPERPPL